MNITDIIIKKTAGFVGDISAKQNTLFDKDKAAEYMKNTAAEKIRAIITEMQEDARAADLFNGMKKGKLHHLAMEAGKVGLIHGCTTWAKEIYEHSKQ